MTGVVFDLRRRLHLALGSRVGWLSHSRLLQSLGQGGRACISNIYGKAMQVEASYPAAQIILSQIAARQQVTEGFERVFADYQRALQNCTVYQVISLRFSSPVHNPRIVVYRS